MDHVSVEGHTPKTALTAQTGLDELKKKKTTMKLSRQGKGGGLGGTGEGQYIRSKYSVQNSQRTKINK